MVPSRFLHESRKKNNRSYLISNTPQKREEMANTPFFIGDT